ncbi:MAG: dual specificity protein phosphatase family protein [Bacteroidota bacterium]
MNYTCLLRLLVLLSLSILPSQFTCAQKLREAEKLELGGLKRFYKLNDSVFRAEQPTKKEFIEMESMGIKSVINFRRNRKDDKKASNTDLQLIHQPLKAKEMTVDDLIDSLRNIQGAEKPILIHCWHGSDRTGVVVAAYRIIFEDWTKKEAIEEFRKKEFGYHENWFPNLEDMLEDLNVPFVKKELGLLD